MSFYKKILNLFCSGSVAIILNDRSLLILKIHVMKHEYALIISKSREKLNDWHKNLNFCYRLSYFLLKSNFLVAKVSNESQ